MTMPSWRNLRNDQKRFTVQLILIAVTVGAARLCGLRLHDSWLGVLEALAVAVVVFTASNLLYPDWKD